MQRLGFLKCVAHLASPGQSQTLEALTQKFESTITQSTNLPMELTDRFEKYVGRYQLHRRYPTPSVRKVQLQDAYLSDCQLPSGSGAITGEVERVGYRHAVYVEIPAWATRLQLVRDRNYSLTDRGKVVRFLSSGERWDRFDPNSNPFVMSSSQAFLFLYCLIDSDGDLLQLLYRKVLDKPVQAFERGDLGVAAAEALEELAVGRLSRQSSGFAKQQTQKARKLVESMRSQRGPAYGPRESIATPRAEPLVDCGWLVKPNPSAYVYQFTPLGRIALTRLAESTSISAFLNDDLAHLVSPGAPSGGPSNLGYLREVYDALKSGLGYVSIRELVIGSIAKHIEAGGPVHSVAELEAILIAAPAKYGPLVRLAQGRSGGLAQVRIHPSAFGEGAND